ncbi:uncharacterized protein EKO05_0007507 [Ascochyta rabiei]|uniref:Uncharacterized protein n=1 Tax=Didymella rabiei TaxID=5454 RepID=A0A162YJA9_DIDRA|nr:uncharacterized protein EKO05_0007507 [Ascochyta rabiei]KZM20077.1 hypothetical protein ST47_g8765 [Ascochyta rabiei]UPX17131.1 hypothetical protein EKO05_0007507 [Ascochyta rabiei]
MVTLHISHTAPLNPPSTTPALAIEQLWAGLQRKVRHAEEFVPVIASCTVLEERDDGTVVRDVVFKAGAGPRERAREVVREFWPSWVDFEQEDGTHIRNVISEGAAGELYMTYMFEFNLPHVQQGESAEVEDERRRLKGMARMAVEKSIETIRAMVRDGRI